ncbi:hypothetical protein CR513_45098, partial [Mucuna pruriens]
MECHYYHKIGHIQNHCFLWKNENKGKKGKSKEKDDDDDHDHDCVATATSDDLVILRDFESVNLVSDESMWIIDSNATLHVTPRKEFFTSYTSGDFGVLKTAKKDMLPRLKNAELEKCSYCMTGKQTEISFKKHSPSRKSELLELVHFDVCGPLKTKDQVLEKFKQFQALVERQSGKKGIKDEKIPPKTPQLNDLAERMNIILIERVGCILSEVRLPKHFWGEALYTTVHVINLNPAVALNTKVSDKIWFDKDVKLYDPVDKKLVISRDVQFMEDQTIEDIDKVKKSTPEKNNNLSEIDPVRMLLGDDFDISLDNDVEEEQEMSQDENLGDAPKPPQIRLKRSNRQRQSSTSQSAIHLGKNSTLHSGSKHVDLRYQWIHDDALDAKLLELAKVNGADMMTKAVPRGNFEACCEIVELTITST